jgi:hypothetical protein
LTGRFSIEASPEDVLLFSYIGFATQETTVPSDGGDMEIILASSTSDLEEVVVSVGLIWSGQGER